MMRGAILELGYHTLQPLMAIVLVHEYIVYEKSEKVLKWKLR